LQAVKEQLRQLPQQGIGYGLLRYLSPDPITRAQLQQLPAAQLLFNYLGQVEQVGTGEQWFGAASESAGPSQSPQGWRSHLLELNAIIAGGQLHVTWTYSAHVHQRTTIERLARDYLAALRALISHCQSSDAGGYTPSDFPLAALTPQTLSKLSSLIDEITEAEELAL